MDAVNCPCSKNMAVAEAKMIRTSLVHNQILDYRISMKHRNLFVGECVFAPDDTSSVPETQLIIISYKTKRVKAGSYTLFERKILSLSLGTNYLHVTIIYIPRRIFSSDEQFSDLLSKLLSLPGIHVILGDSNFRTNDPTDTHAVGFKLWLNSVIWSSMILFLLMIMEIPWTFVLITGGLSVDSIFTGHSVKQNKLLYF